MGISGLAAAAGTAATGAMNTIGQGLTAVGLTDPAIWANLGNMGVNAAATLYNKNQVNQMNRFNAEQAQLNRDWQEKMSNSAYQRAVADMRKAGINPILAATQGGASTPSGATASGGASSASTSAIEQMKTLAATQQAMIMGSTALRVAENVTAEMRPAIKETWEEIKAAAPAVAAQIKDRLIEAAKKGSAWSIKAGQSLEKWAEQKASEIWNYAKDAATVSGQTVANMLITIATDGLNIIKTQGPDVIKAVYEAVKNVGEDGEQAVKDMFGMGMDKFNEMLDELGEMVFGPSGGKSSGGGAGRSSVVHESSSGRTHGGG